MTGAGDPDELDDVPITDLDDETNQDQEDIVFGDTDPTAGASDIGGRAGEA